MRNSRAFLIVGVALFLALAAVLVAARWMSEQGPAGTRVVVASVEIAQGTRLQAAKLELAEWPSGALPPGAVSDVKLLEGRVAGEPQDCIYLPRIRSSQIIDGTAIVYDAGSTIYVNRPRNGADTLDDDDIIAALSYIKSRWPSDVQRRHDELNRSHQQVAR